jgi:hypothetical protein
VVLIINTATAEMMAKNVLVQDHNL